MALLFFSRIFLKIFRVFLVRQNNLWEPFHKNPENKIGSVQNKTMETLNKPLH